MFQDTFKVKGSLVIDHFNDNNQLIDKREINNLVVADGKNVISSRLLGNAIAIMSHMSVGTDNTSPTTSDTLLGGEIAKVALDSSSITNNTITYIATFPAGTGTGSLTEAGIFNNATANTGNMLCRTTFNVVNKAVADTIVISWNVTIE